MVPPWCAPGIAFSPDPERPEVRPIYEADDWIPRDWKSFFAKRAAQLRVDANNPWDGDMFMARAVHYYRLAAAYDEASGACDSQGHPRAQTWLGYMHLVGEGVPLDRHKARACLEAARMNDTKEGQLAAACLAELDEEPPLYHRGELNHRL